MTNKPANKASKPASSENSPSPATKSPSEPEHLLETMRESVFIGDETDEFVRHIDSLSATFPLSMVAIKRAHKVAREQYDKFEKNHCKTLKVKGNNFVLVDSNYEGEYQRLSKQDTRVSIASKTVPRSFVVSLISQYDSFLGRLIRALFYLRPELLNSSEKLLSFSKLSEFSKLEDAKEYIIEKEVETVLRKSHSDQFDWLENKLGTTLRKELPVWPTFVEVTERRNLFVHSNGVVSSQYLQVCKDHSVDLDKDLKVGVVLGMTPAYFDTAHRAIYELGVKLAHVIWRRQNPKDIENADRHLINICYDLLREERYDLAKVILDFATLTLKKHFDEENRRVFVVNRAQAYKWSGDEKTAQEIISGEDWSATSNEFKLAEAVLTDNFNKATSLMQFIGNKGTPSEAAYKAWPLFKEFRKTKEFLETYEAVFGEPFSRIKAEGEELSEDTILSINDAKALTIVAVKRASKDNGKSGGGEENVVTTRPRTKGGRKTTPSKRLTTEVKSGISKKPLKAIEKKQLVKKSPPRKSAGRKSRKS